MSFLTLGKREYENAVKIVVGLGYVIDKCYANLGLLITESNTDISYSNLPKLKAFPSHFENDDQLAKQSTHNLVACLLFDQRFTFDEFCAGILDTIFFRS